VIVEAPGGFAKTIDSVTLDGVPLDVDGDAARATLPSSGGTHEIRIMMS
jgi:hypothetical protein